MEGFWYGFACGVMFLPIILGADGYLFGPRDRTWYRTRVERSFRGMKRRDIQREVADIEERVR